MKIAVAQTNSLLGNYEKNLENHLQFCSEAIKHKSDIIVFPELSLTGYSLEDINYDIAVNIKNTSKLEKLLKISEKIDIICGFVEEDDNFKVFNSSLYLSGHKILHNHRKIYPPTYGIFEESRYFSKGRVCNSFETNKGKSGLLICEDMWHISLPYILAMDGAKIIYGLAASPTRLSVGSKEFRNYEINSEHHRTFARLLSVYFVFSNRIGYEDGVNFWGGSEIVDPFGNVLAKGKLFEEDLLFADIDMNTVKEARHQARHFLDEDIDNTIYNLKNIGMK
jgi:NAD+ synthase (glutamine-hydrolysing)